MGDKKATELNPFDDEILDFFDFISDKNNWGKSKLFKGKLIHIDNKGVILSAGFIKFKQQQNAI